MRRPERIRGALLVFSAVVLLIGGLVPAAAQELTPEATEVFTSDMMMMKSSCPQNVAATLVDRLATMAMEMSAEPAGSATEESPRMESTQSGIDLTAEPLAGPLCLVGAFSGAAEVPGPGDDDGLGLAFVTFDHTTGEVCYEVAVANIELPAQAMHIHVGATGEAGGVVIPFPNAPDEQGQAVGCTQAEDLTVLEDLAAQPEGYYVNVHTTDYPDGAVRAQLLPLAGEGQLMLERMGLQLFDLRGDTADMNPPAAILAGSQWRLASYGDPNNQIPVTSASDITLAFTTETQVEGFGGCNGYSGQYQTADTSITFSSVVHTLVACSDSAVMEQEQAYFDALNSATQYQGYYDRLFITYGDGQELRFIIVPHDATPEPSSDG